MALKQNWEAMVTAWKRLVANPRNAALKAKEKGNTYLSLSLEVVKGLDTKFKPAEFPTYKRLCLFLDKLIERCEDVTDDFTKTLPEAAKFAHGVSQAAKDRKTSALLEVQKALAHFKQIGAATLSRLTAAGSDREKAGGVWVEFMVYVNDARMGESFPGMEDARRVLINMLPPDGKNSKASLNDYKTAVYKFIQATGHAF